MLVRRQRLDRSVVGIGHALERQPATPALRARVGAFGHQPGAGRSRDPPGEPLRALVHRLAAEQQKHILLLAQHARRLRHRMRIGLGGDRHRLRLGHHAAVVPRRVARQDQRRDAARRGAGGRHCRRSVAADLLGRGHGPHEARHAARPAFGVRGQRRVERAVIGRLVADHVDDAGAGAPRVMQVGKPVREPRPAMQERGGGLAAHPVIAVGSTCDHVLLQAQHALHAGDAVERRDEVHLTGAGIGKAGVHAALQQRVDEGFSAIHGKTAAVGSTRSSCCVIDTLRQAAARACGACVQGAICQRRRRELR